jgi:hypothetical protein
MPVNDAKLDAILEQLNTMNTTLAKLDKRIAHLESDMKKVLKCVATENADFNPLDGVGKVKPSKALAHNS